MSIRRTNSNLSGLGRMNSNSLFLNRDESNSNAFAIEKLRQEVHELKTLQYEQLRLLDELISILGPVFPRSVEQEAFVEASAVAQQSATASMVNANLRGERFIQKVLPLAMIIDSRDSGTPSNMARIKAMLKTLKGYEEEVRPEDVTDEQIEDDYKALKHLARRIHQAFVMDHPDLKRLSWSKLGQGYPTTKSKMILDLEKKAFDRNINIHHCKDMWAADRLLFDAFRGSRICGVNNDLGASGRSNGNNSRSSRVSSLSSSDNGSIFVESLASVLGSTVTGGILENDPFSIVSRQTPSPVPEASLRGRACEQTVGYSWSNAGGIDGDSQDALGASTLENEEGNEESSSRAPRAKRARRGAYAKR